MRAPRTPERTRMADVALRAGVSVATVSLALQRHPRISPETTDRVMAAARDLDYRPSPLLRKALRSIRAGHRAKGLVLAWIHRGHTDGREAPLFVTARDVARLQGYELESFALRNTGIDALRRIMRARGMPGALLCGMEELLDSWGPEPFGPSVRVVAIQDRASDLSGIPTVSPHNDSLVRMVLHELLRRHYRAPGVVSVAMHQTNPPLLGTLNNRLPLSPEFRAVPWHRLGVTGQLERFKEWFEEHRPDCLISDNAAVLAPLAKLGLSAPRDVGFLHLDLDGQTRSPAFGGIDRRRPEIVKLALQLLVSLIEHGRGWELELVTSTQVRPRWLDGESLPFRPAGTTRESPPRRDRFQPPPDAQWHCLPLQPALNQPLTAVGGWFGDHPLRYFPTGRQEFAGIPFQIVDDVQSGGRSLLVLRSAAIPRGTFGPLPESARIKVENRVAEVYLLHAAAWVDGPDPFGYYRFLYEDGSTAEQPLAPSGGKIAPIVHDWWRSCPSFSNAATKHVAITAYGDAFEYLANLYVWRWRNPHPERRLAAIEVQADVRKRSTIAVIAATARLAPDGSKGRAPARSRP